MLTGLEEPVIKSESDILSPEARVKEILSLIPLDHLDQTKDVDKLVNNLPRIFKLDQDTLKATTAVELAIPLKTDKFIGIVVPGYEMGWLRGARRQRIASGELKSLTPCIMVIHHSSTFIDQATLMRNCHNLMTLEPLKEKICG